MTEQLKYWLKSLVRKFSKAENYRELASEIYLASNVKIKYLKYRDSRSYKTIEVDSNVLYDALIKLAEECESSILKITKSNFFKEEVEKIENIKEEKPNEQN